MFDINVRGLLFSVQKALPLMPEGSSIVLNASLYSLKGAGGCTVYSATKAAVRSFARTWTSDLKDRKIRVNALSPGYIETQILDKAGISKEQKDHIKPLIAAQIPLGRWGRPEEIAKAAVFLASSDSSYVAGVELFADGGDGQV
jgi:NAD(P)-dependent dehydrogenase (short-subunit alcohol dehydrogenase family)